MDFNIIKELEENISGNVIMVFSTENRKVVSRTFGLLLLSNMIKDSYMVGHFPNNCVLFSPDMVTSVEYDEDSFLVIHIVV